MSIVLSLFNAFMMVRGKLSNEDNMRKFIQTLDLYARLGVKAIIANHFYKNWSLRTLQKRLNC